MAELISERERLQALRAQRAQGDELPEAPSGQPEANPSPVQPWAARLIRAVDLGDEDWLTGDEPLPTPALITWDEHHLMIPAGRVGLIVAPGGTGKSSLLCQLAITVATGHPWLDTYTLKGEPGRVLLIMGEEDQDEIKRKLYWAAREGLTDLQRARALHHIDCLPLSGIPAPLLEADAGGMPMSSHFSTWLQELIADDQGGKLPPYRLIIMDPLSRMMGAAQENDNGLATRFIQELEQLTQTPGAPTVVIAHHTNKGAMNQAHGGEATNQGAARGASALVDGARLMINLEPHPAPDELEQGWGGTRITLRVTKSNYGPAPRPLELFWPTGERVFRPASHDELSRWLREERDISLRVKALELREKETVKQLAKDDSQWRAQGLIKAKPDEDDDDPMNRYTSRGSK